MKRVCLSIFAVLAIAAAPVLAQDTSLNVNAFTAPELAEAPVIDGDLSDAVWAGVPEIIVDQPGDGLLAPTYGEGDMDIIAKIAWDDETNALYFGITVKDNSYVNTEGAGSSAGGNGYEGERLELIIDGQNTGDPASNTTSGWHQQYCFDLANNWDPNNPENGEYGFYDVPVSTSFISIPVYESITDTMVPDISAASYAYPFNLSDDFLESAAQIRATQEGLANWEAAPVEWNWEIKMVVFDELLPNSIIGVVDEVEDIDGDGWKAFFIDPDQIVKDLEVNGVIGFTVQHNDADEYPIDGNATRTYQINTTGFEGNWNSSENLSGLILGPAAAGVSDWSMH